MTNVQIVNVALRLNGIKQISALSDSVESARIMNDLFEPCRDDELINHPWDFAIEYSDALAENVDAPNFDYDYSYALPSDCLRVIELEDAGDEYKVVGSNLYTNIESPKIKYIKKVTTPGNFSQSFCTVLSARLAAESCFALTNDKALTKQRWDEYKAKSTKAKSNDSQEGTTEKEEISSWIEDRE